MLHHFLFAPFSDPTRQQLFEEVRAALRDDEDGPVSLLLGNFAVAEAGEPLDAVVIRPHSITVLVFVPGGGQLSIPSLTYGAWKLDQQTVCGVGGADNPFEQFQRQKEALAAWLTPQLPAEQANLQFISGVVVFGAPVTFSPDVEQQLSQQPGSSFQLLAAVAQLPRRLRQLARPEIDLTGEELTQWARDLADEPATASAAPAAQPLPASGAEPEPVGEQSFWQRAWRWLGAEDIPADTPYGGYPAEQVAASSAEKERLERMQHESQAELRQQLQALEAREAERERNMAELREQLAQAPPVTTEAQALRDRLAAESREKATLEEAIRASQAAFESRNRELDAKIQQLGTLLDQLNARSATSPPQDKPSTATAAASVTSLAPQAPLGYRQLRLWRRRLPRVAALAGTVGLLGLGVWGLSHLSTGTLKPYQENGKWGFADESGKPVVAPRYSSVGEFQQERAVVEADGAYGLIDEDGKEVVAPAYDALNPYAGGYARVRVGEAYTFLDEKGQEFDSYYFNALDFSEGHAAVLDHRGWHYIQGPDPEDPAKPPVIFREAYSFRDGLARVRLADGYTYITKDYLSDPSAGTEPFGRYELATDFDEDRAQVMQNGRRFTIDTDGDEVK